MPQIQLGINPLLIEFIDSGLLGVAGVKGEAVFEVEGFAFGEMPVDF